LRVANVQAGHIDLSEVREIDATDEEISRFGLEEDDVLMTEGGDPDKLGRGALWDSRINPCIHQNHIFRVRLDKRRVFPAYFARLLGTRWAVDYFVKAAKQTTGIATINKTQLRGFPVPLPPLPEQKRIAAILDKADAIRRKRQEAIRLTEELLRSAFLEMFGDPVTNPKGWEVRELESLADIGSGIAKGRKLRGERLTIVPYMRVANVQDGHIDLSDVKTIEVTDAEREKFALEVGDLLLTEGGDPDKLGPGAVWRGELSPCVHQNHIFRVRVTFGKVRPEYLSALIGSRHGKRYFLRAAKQTTGIATINKTQLRAFPVLLPPLKLQNDYVNVLSSIETHGSRLGKAERDSHRLGHALTQCAFSGKL